jgi:hypothetical protein
MSDNDRDGWNERRLIGAIRVRSTSLFVSVLTWPSGRKAISVSVGNNGETPRGIVIGPLLARTVRDLLDEAIGATGDSESHHGRQHRRKFLGYVIDAGTHGRSAAHPGAVKASSAPSPEPSDPNLA